MNLCFDSIISYESNICVQPLGEILNNDLIITHPYMSGTYFKTEINGLLEVTWTVDVHQDLVRTLCSQVLGQGELSCFHRQDCQHRGSNCSYFHLK